MGKRGLYPTLSGNKLKHFTKDLMNFLTYSDGKNDLKNISKLIKKNYPQTKKIYKLLLKEKLLIN